MVIGLKATLIESLLLDMISSIGALTAGIVIGFGIGTIESYQR